MDLYPIRTDADHAAALAEIERLWGAAEGSPEGDRLEVLTTLVEAYEERRWPVVDVDPVELIEFAISEMGRSQKELAVLLGSRSRASETLKRQRPLTLAMIHKLVSQWGLPAEAMVRPYAVNAGARRIKKEVSAASPKRGQRSANPKQPSATRPSG